MQSLVAGAYAAAFDDALWPMWTEQMVDAFGGAGGSLLVVDPASAAAKRRLFVRADPDVVCAYERDRIGRLDPQIPYLAKLSHNAVYTDADYNEGQDREARQHAEFIAEHMGWSRHLTGAGQIGSGENNMVAGLSIYGAQGSVTISAEKRVRLAAILPQINNAMALAFGHSMLLIDAFWEGHCGTASEPSLLLDDKGRMIRKTASLNELAQRSDAFTIQARRPAAIAPSVQRQLHAAIQRAVRRDGAAGGTVLLPSISGEATLVAMLRPIPWASRLMAPAEAAAIITIVDPTRRPNANDQAWSSVFGLTVREAELARLLVDGHSLKSAAQVRQRGMETLRAQLRSIFDKTGVGRQSDLVSLLTRIN